MRLSLFATIVVLAIGMMNSAAINTNAGDLLEALFDEVTILDDDSHIE